MIRDLVFLLVSTLISTIVSVSVFLTAFASPFASPFASAQDITPHESRREQARPAFVAPSMTTLSADLPAFEYVDVGPEIPNYAAGRGKTMNLMPQPLSAVESMKHLVTPAGFHVELFADESMFEGKPIAMNWDARGRLWVCETVDYPNGMADNAQGRDHVRILEDTNGDGKADRSTLFAKDLSIPTAITFHRGGAVVQNGTETLYLKDTNGDDVADVRTVLMSDWGVPDTHGGVSNFRYGLDNWIWAMQGYNTSQPVINCEKQQAFRMGFFRFQLSQTDPPTVEKLEFIRSTTNNTWGLGVTEEGLIFGSTANRQPSFFMPIANRYYERVRGWAPEVLEMICPDHLFQPITKNVRQVDHHGGYTAAAGHSIYTARKYPQQWWNRAAFVCGPTGHLVGTFVVTPEGAGFRSQTPTNLIASDDQWTAPIMAEVGPDGNVWVLDWYNYIVQHNPTPHGFKTGKGRAYETELRDKKYGRVYRVVYGDVGVEAAAVPLSMQPEDWVKQLSDPTMLVRLSAQRLLVERGNPDVAPLLLQQIADPSVDAIGLNVGAIHALQTLKGLGQLDAASGEAFSVVIAALKHPSAGVRLNAIRVLPDDQKSLTAMVAAGPLQDPDPQVALAYLLALADTSSADAGELITTAVADPQVMQDRWLRDAATSAAAMHADSFLLAMLDRTQSVSPDAVDLLARVAEHFARSTPPTADVETLVNAMPGSDRATVVTIIAGLHKGWPEVHPLTLSSDTGNRLTTLFGELPDQSKAALIGLAKTWGTEALKQEMSSIAKSLMKQVSNANAPIEGRLAAADSLIALDPARVESTNRLFKMIDPLAPPSLSLGLIRVAGRSQVDGLGDRYVQLYGESTPAIRDGIMEVMLSRTELTMRLLEAINSGELRLSDLSALQRQNLAEHPNETVRTAAVAVMRAGGALVNSDRAKIVEAKMPLMANVGNADAGKLIFTKNCGTCHIFNGEGQMVGPNLSGMSVHPKTELLTHILDPSRSVEANYRAYTVLTIDGLIVSGILSAESRTSIEIIDAQAKKHTIQRDDIDQLQPSQKSAMPEGLETSINDQGLTDLLEYLTTKQRFVQLPLDAVATTLTTKGMFNDRDNDRETLIFESWGERQIEDVPFTLIDPRGDARKNAIMLYGPNGRFAPSMPHKVIIPCRTSATAIHVLGGVGGWSSQKPTSNGVSMIVRLHYVNGKTEDQRWVDGQHMADYIQRFDVPKSKFALLAVGGQQLRYLKVVPKRKQEIKSIELVKSDHPSAPIIMSVTVETDVEHQAAVSKP